MNLRIRRCLPPLATGAALLGLAVAMAAGLDASTRALELEPESGLDALDAALVPRAERDARPVRASLSMPYFSFGQSLRPRG